MSDIFYDVNEYLLYEQEVMERVKQMHEELIAQAKGELPAKDSESK